MKERTGNWLFAALVLLSCGGVEGVSSLQKSREALACQTDTDCGSGYACAHFSQRNYCEPSAAAASTTASFVDTPGGPRACRTNADCGAAEECESEHASAYYCAPHHEEGKAYYGADAGAPTQRCRHDGEDCYGSQGCSDAGPSAACDAGVEQRGDAHEDESYEDGHHEGGDGYDDRRGSNSGRD